MGLGIICVAYIPTACMCMQLSNMLIVVVHLRLQGFEISLMIIFLFYKMYV